AFAEQRTEFFADFQELGQVLDVAARERVFDDRGGSSATRGRIHSAAHFGASFFNKSNDFADFGFHKVCPLEALVLKPIPQGLKHQNCKLVNVRASSDPGAAIYGLLLIASHPRL